jgi:GTP-binding protein
VSAAALPNVLSAEYLSEVRAEGGLPPVGAIEIAIAGRSNVGKSTLLNRLTNRRHLARTSKTPGRTRGLIFYDVTLRPAQADAGTTLALRFVDLPGYGYAQVSKSERAGWGPLIEGYVERRPTLALFLVLADGRRGLEEEERQLLEWLGTLHVPACVVATKVDKLSATERGGLKDRWKAAAGGRLPPFVAASGETGDGVDQLWKLILKAVERGRPQPPAP